MDNCLAPDYDNIALLTIDVQNDFTLSSAPLEVSGTREVLPNIRKLISTFRNQGKPIVHIVRLYLPDGSNVDLCRREKRNRRYPNRNSKTARRNNSRVSL